MSILSLLMRSVIVLVTLLTVSQCFTCSESMYEDYLSHWNRNFTEEKGAPQYTTKYEAYCRNREYVDDINSQNLSYDLDIYWQWMDKTDSEREGNFIINSALVKVEFTPEAIAATAVPEENVNIKKVSAAIPSYVDYRESGDVSSIKSQGSCGCCWSFTTVGTYESWMMLKGEKEYDLSEEYLLECTTKFTQNIQKANYQSTCNGGYVDFAGELARLNGIPTQTQFPYLGKDFTGSTFPTTPGICEANETIMYARDPSVTTFSVARNNTNDKMKQLIASGPVATLIYADTGFQAYRSGVYSGCPSSFVTSYSRINHAVVIIGYDVDGNYIIKNSWGTSWGNNGFGVVNKNNDCGLSAYAFQFSSNAAPGNGVLFYNQTNLNGSTSSGQQIMASVLIFVIMLVMILIH